MKRSKNTEIAGRLFLVVLFSICSTFGAPSFGEEVPWKSETDPAALFAARCANCHGAGFAPNLNRLSQLNADEIEEVLWNGVMQTWANGLDIGQRRLLAQWISGLSPNKETDEAGVPACSASQGTTAIKNQDSWSNWGKDLDFTRDAKTPSITASRVMRTRLEYALPLPLGKPTEGAANPVSVMGNRLFMGNINHWVYALDAGSGCALWTFRADGRVRSNVAVEGETLVFADLLSNVYGLSARDGHVLWRTHVESSPSARLTANVTLADGVAYLGTSSTQEVSGLRADDLCCSFRGAVLALDARNGQRRWRAPMIDGDLRFLGKTKDGFNRYGPSGAPVWSGIAIDKKRGLAYVTTGNQYTEPKVAESDAVIALDLQTGAKRWIATLAPAAYRDQDIYYFGCNALSQTKGGNCSPDNPERGGDRDFGAPPALVRLPNGQERVMAASKDGILYSLDPDSGRLIWQARAGKGGDDGGVLYGFATDENNAYLPITDIDSSTGTADGSFVALDLSTGKIVWRTSVDAKKTCKGKPGIPLCTNAFATPPTVAGEVVFTGSNDGVLRAYNRRNGKLVWSYDTYREFTGANGIRGHGGSLGFGGPTVVNDHVYIMTGHSIFGLGMPGNVLLSFEIPVDVQKQASISKPTSLGR